jgi:hypothetical protein
MKFMMPNSQINHAGQHLAISTTVVSQLSATTELQKNWKQAISVSTTTVLQDS